MKKFIKRYGSAGELVIHVGLFIIISGCVYVMMNTENMFYIVTCLIVSLIGLFVGGFMDYCRDAVIKEEYYEEQK